MNIDNAGHKSGKDSSHYRNTIRNSDSELSKYLPKWIEAGYQIIITADQGMNDDKSHGGTLSTEHDIPLFVIGNRFSHQQNCIPKQTEIYGIICELLGIENYNKSVTDNFLLEDQQIKRPLLQSVASVSR